MPDRVEPMRVLHVTESYGGGVASVVEQYRSHPFARHFLLARVREGDVDSSEVQAGPQTRFVAGTRQLIRQWFTVRRIDWDVVHAHSSWAGLLVRAFPPRSAAIVYTPHGIASIGHPRRMVRVAARWAESLLARRTDAGAAVGAFEAEQLAAAGIARSRIIVVPHAVAVPPEPAQPPADEPITAVGRICYAKNPEEFAHLATAGRDAAGLGRFRWIGDGDPEGRARLIEAGVEVTGWLPRAQAARLAAESRAIVVTSRSEGLPVSVLDGMAAGVPVVARNIPSLRELAVLRYDDEAECLDQLAMLRDDSEWRRRGERERSQIREQFTSAAQGQALSRAYECALRSRRPDAPPAARRPPAAWRA